MKRVGKILVCGGYLAFCLHLAGGEALAADAAWRPMYDLIMRWVNFLILAFLIFKFGRVPIMNFLKGQRFDLAKEIDELNAQKAAAEFKLQEIQQELDTSNTRFVEITERLIRDGERRRDGLIADARLEGEMLIEGAKRKAESRFIQARQQLRSQLVDNVMDTVLERLPAIVNEADNQRFSNEFLKKVLV